MYIAALEPVPPKGCPFLVSVFGFIWPCLDGNALLQLVPTEVQCAIPGKTVTLICLLYSLFYFPEAFIFQKQQCGHIDEMVSNMIETLETTIKDDPSSAVKLRELLKDELFRLALKEVSLIHSVPVHANNQEIPTNNSRLPYSLTGPTT